MLYGGEFVYGMGVRTTRGLSRIAVVDILIFSMHWGRAGRLVYVKQMSSALHRRGFNVRSERGENFSESHNLIGRRLLGCVLLSETRHDNLYGRVW